MTEKIISVRLPLPIPVVSELGSLIDKRWPGAALVVGEEGAPGYLIDPEHMHFRIDWEAEPGEEDEPAMELNHIDPDGGMGFGTKSSEEVAVGMVSMFKDILDAHDAPNFVTMTVLGQDEKYEVTVRRLDGKAPAEHIAELEAELATYREAQA